MLTVPLSKTMESAFVPAKSPLYHAATESGVSSNGKRTGTRRSDLLLHVCTHAHYTAAQVVNMLRQLGESSLPDPMLITLARQQRTQPEA